MTTKHTPGPWGFIWADGTHVIDADHGKKDIAHVINRGNPDATEANARLIAAAPDLLKSLIDVMGWFDSSAIRGIMSKQGYQAEAHRIINEARKAIAKAEGGAA